TCCGGGRAARRVWGSPARTAASAVAASAVQRIAATDRRGFASAACTAWRPYSRPGSSTGAVRSPAGMLPRDSRPEGRSADRSADRSAGRGLWRWSGALPGLGLRRDMGVLTFLIVATTLGRPAPRLSNVVVFVVDKQRRITIVRVPSGTGPWHGADLGKRKVGWPSG